MACHTYLSQHFIIRFLEWCLFSAYPFLLTLNPYIPPTLPIEVFRHTVATCVYNTKMRKGRGIRPRGEEGEWKLEIDRQAGRQAHRQRDGSLHRHLVSLVQ